MAKQPGSLQRAERTLKPEHAAVCQERQVFTGEYSAVANLMLSIMGAFADFETLSSRNAKGKSSHWQTMRCLPRKERTLTPEQAADWSSESGTCSESHPCP